MLNCRDVHHRVSSGEAEASNWMRRIEMRLHLMMCAHCRNYVMQIAAIGEGVRRLCGSEPADPAELERMEHRICACLNGETED